MNDTYFVNTVKGKRGPFTLENLKQFVERGSVKESTAVSVGDTEIWIKAKTIPGLFPENAVLEETPESVSLPDNSVPGISNSSPMFCCYCGKPTPGGAAFCPSCGKPATKSTGTPIKPNVMELAARKYLAEGEPSLDDILSKVGTKESEGDPRQYTQDRYKGTSLYIDPKYLTMSVEEFEADVLAMGRAADAEMIKGNRKPLGEYVHLTKKLQKIYEERFGKKPKF